MPRIEWVEEAEATGEVAEVYRSFMEWRGRDQVAGIVKCFSHRPDFMAQMLEFSRTLHFSDGHLDQRTKELIATLVSGINRCRYCAESHAHYLQPTETDETISALTRGDLAGAAVTPKERELLRLVETVTRHAYRTTDEDVQRLRECGWTDAQIAEGVYITALFAFYNRVADAFGLESAGYGGTRPVWEREDNAP